MSVVSTVGSGILFARFPTVEYVSTISFFFSYDIIVVALYNFLSSNTFMVKVSFCVLDLHLSF